MRPLLLLLCLLALPAQAATEADTAAIESLSLLGDDARPVGLKQSIEDALAGNLGLRARVLELEASEKRMKAAWSPFLPLLTAGANYRPQRSENLLNEFDQQFWQRSTTNSGGYNIGIGAFLPTGTDLRFTFTQGAYDTETIYDPKPTIDSGIPGVEPIVVRDDFGYSTRFASVGLNINQSILQGISPNYQLRGVRKARVVLDALDATREQDVITVTANVLKAYWDLVALRRNVEIKRISVKLAEEQRDVTRARIAAGDQAPIELFRIDETVATRHAELLEAERTAEEMEQSFKLYLGISPTEAEFAVPLRPLDGIASVLPGRDRERSRQVALEQNPSLLAQRRGMATNRIDEQTANHEMLPDLSISAGLTLSGNGFDMDEAFQDIAETKFPDFELGLNFAMPLPDLGAVRTLEAAKLDVTRAELDIKSTELDVLAGIESAFRSIKSFDEQLRVAEVRTTLAGKNTEAAEATYEAGRGTLRDVLEAQQALEEARQAHVSSEVAALKARVDLELLRGTLLEALGVEYD
jgi:outer membrane protein TolC